MKKQQFQKKFMHPTKRKLVDMVFKGEYDKNTTISKHTNKIIDRQVGEEWTDDNGNIWIQKNGYKIKKSKNTDIYIKLRNELSRKSVCKNDECKKVKYGTTDKQLILETGYCSDCLAELETPIRINGDWEPYSKFRLYHRMYREQLLVLDKLNQALESVDSVDEIINADGNIQRWNYNGDKEELRTNILKDIDYTTELLNEILTNRNSLIDIIKDKKYKIVEELFHSVGLIETDD